MSSSSSVPFHAGMPDGETPRAHLKAACEPCRLLKNIDDHAHVAVVGATEVIADGDIAADGLWSDGELSGLAGDHVAIDLQWLAVEAVGHVFRDQLDSDG